MSEIVKYGATAKWLHWPVAIIVILMLVFGRTLEALPIPEREQMIMAHSGLGTLVIALMIIRLAWRLSHQPPGATTDMGLWQIRVSKAMHWGLYGLFILQPVLGIMQAMYLTDYEVLAFGVIDYSGLAADDATRAQLFHALHSFNAWILSVLVIGHIIAAFYHHWFQKDDVLRRMIPFGKVEN